MNFYLDIANSLYTNTTEINGTHFYDRYEYIGIKHTESQFKGKVFYQNLINELVKHWRAKTPLSKGEHFSDDCISLVNYCKEKIAEVSGSEILKNVDIRYNLDVDFPEDGFYKTLYDTYKRQIDRCGFYQIIDNNVAVNIYHPGLAVILSSPREIPVYDSNRQVLNIDCWKFLDDYVSGYKNGISYFDENFAVEPNVLYGSKAESYIQTIHKNYFHEIHEGRSGWHFVKNHNTFNLTHKNIYDFGYYSGIISKVDAMVKKHAPLFKSFDKCECQLKQTGLDQKPEQAIENISDKSNNGLPKFKSEKVDTIFNILKDFFSQEDQFELNKVLASGNHTSQKLFFLDNGNRLADAFKQLYDADFITSCQKNELEKWIAENFSFRYRGRPKEYKAKYLNDIISTKKDMCQKPILNVKSGVISKVN